MGKLLTGIGILIVLAGLMCGMWFVWFQIIWNAAPGVRRSWIIGTLVPVAFGFAVMSTGRVLTILDERHDAPPRKRSHSK